MIQGNSRETYRALAELARRYQFRSQDEVCCYGVTVSQCYALEFLCETEHSTASGLAHHLGLDLSSSTRLVDQLVRKKLVTRQRSAMDARIREIRVTDAGKRVAARLQQDLIALLDRALTDLPPQVRQALPDALRSITRALNECGETPNFIPVESVRKTGT